MTTTTNNTTTAIITIDRYAQRKAAAAARHPNTTAAVIALYAWTSSNTAAAEKALPVGSKAVWSTLNYLYQQDGTKLWNDLLKDWKVDQQAANIASIAADAMTKKAAHDTMRDRAQLMQRIADRVTTPEEQAEAAREEAAAAREIAKELREEGEDLERIIRKAVSTDRADLDQIAATAYWQTNNYKMATKAVRAAVRKMANPDAMTANRTDLTAVKAEEAEEFNKLHGEGAKVPYYTRKGQQNGYITMEQRKATKTRAAGWYRVHHRKTVAPYVSFEVFASADGSGEIVKNGGINAVCSQQAMDDLQDIIERSNLNECERNIVRYMLDQTAAKAGMEAAGQHMKEAAARAALAKTHKGQAQILRRAQEGAEKARHAAMWENALKRAGITTERSQQRKRAAIHEKLQAAKAAMDSRHAQPLTEQEKAERAARDIAYMQSNRSRYQRTSREAYTAPEIMPKLTATIHAPKLDEAQAKRMKEYADKLTAAALHFVDSGVKPQPITAEEAAAAAAKAEQERQQHQQQHMADIAYLEYRRSLRSHTPSRTAYAAHDAIAAAFVFVDAFTAEDIRAWYEAEQAEKARIERIRAAAKASGIYSLNSTLEQWLRWSKEERAAHLEFLRSLHN